MAENHRSELRDKIRVWEETIRGDSEMYSRLALATAADDALLDLLAHVNPGQLHMNMLLGAVQYLLIRGRDDPLADHYPSLDGSGTLDGLETHFAAFVAARRDEIAMLIATRRVQTNEVGRCTFLLPAYNVVSALTGRPIALIEIGTSAGLNQNVDRYGYRYDSDAGPVALEASSPVLLTSETGAEVPKPAGALPRIAWRRGLDLHPIDVTDPDQARWLRALVWPDQPERHRRLEAAIEVARLHPPHIAAGDVVEVLPELAAEAPPDAALVIQHSFVLNQIGKDDRARLLDLLDDLAADRSVYRVGAEWNRTEGSTDLDLTIHGPRRSTSRLAAVHHHGAWIRWD